MFIPYAQRPVAGVSQVLVVNTKADIGPSIHRIVETVDARVAVARLGSMDAVVAAALAEPLRLRFFLMLFAGLGLVLGAIGVYGVVSYAVTRRRAEFGIRMALGATSANVLREVIRRGMIPVAIGVVVGVIVSLGLAKVVARFLYQVAPTDPASLGVAAAVLLVTGAVAAVVPAWRAGRTSPVEVLRVE